MAYFCRISIFAVKNTQKYLVFDPSEITRIPYVQTMLATPLRTPLGPSFPYSCPLATPVAPACAAVHMSPS
jgi:hypothetical protein